MKRSNTVAAVVAVLVAIAMGWSAWSDRSSRDKLDTPALQPLSEASPGSGNVEATRSPVGLVDEEPGKDMAVAASESDADLAREALIRSDPKLLDRAEQSRLARAGEARWSEAVDTGEYSASDLDPAIRDFFADVDLEPRYVEDGLITGLEIQALRDDHPLARAGFAVGDRLSRLQGVQLRDPAAIPSLLARLGPNLSICSEREDGEHCAEIALE